MNNDGDDDDWQLLECGSDAHHSVVFVNYLSLKLLTIEHPRSENLIRNMINDFPITNHKIKEFLNGQFNVPPPVCCVINWLRDTVQFSFIGEIPSSDIGKCTSSNFHRKVKTVESFSSCSIAKMGNTINSIQHRIIRSETISTPPLRNLTDSQVKILKSTWAILAVKVSQVVVQSWIYLKEEKKTFYSHTTSERKFSFCTLNATRLISKSSRHSEILRWLCSKVKISRSAADHLCSYQSHFRNTRIPEPCQQNYAS